MRFSLAHLAILWTASLAASTVSEAPEVTLSHGGILRGLSTTFQSVPVDLFLGVRFAQPPVGELRFKKPKELPGWEGTVNADSVGNLCAQITMMSNEVIGDEDCLFLDITIPGGVQEGADKKPVMVWIHGGGYTAGTGINYIGAPLAVTGDVIVVSINYRLGVFGFLSNGPGTGNYGLWDQRAALVWVQQNIAKFGGDPELVTIYGESAGAASVSALTMSPHSEGLFKRAIQQSGTLFQPWGWCLTAGGYNLDALINDLRTGSDCTESQADVYECLSGLATEKVLKMISVTSPLEQPINPTADGDFFSEDLDIDSYKLSERFDLLSGMNGQEGHSTYTYDMLVFATKNNKSFENGVDEELMNKYLENLCSNRLTPLSPHLCVDFLADTYDLDEAEDDKERALGLMELAGDSNFGVDVMYNLEQHSRNSNPSTVTYGYYFTELVIPEPEYQLMPIQTWAKKSADHADDLNFVFGTAFAKDEESSLWMDTVKKDKEMSTLLLGAKESDKELSTTMMLMWTNFAKSGNPNEPISLPSGTPHWPQFNTETNLVMEINSNKNKVITAPNLKQKHKVRQILYADRRRQYESESSNSGSDQDTISQGHDEL